MSNRKASKTALASKLPRFVDMSVENYHRDYSALSKSMLWQFRQCKAIYEALYVSRTKEPEPPSRVMEIGTLVHAGVLEPKTFQDRYLVYPAECLNKNGDLNWKPAENFRSTAPAGKICLKPSELDTVIATIASVADKLDSWLSLGSRREQVIYWTEPTTGLLCRCLCDWLIISKGTAYCLDLKTTSDANPDAFRYKCEDFGYHLQSEHYSEGVGLVTGLPVEFLFVVVETKFPYRCSIQKLSSKDRHAAGESRRRIMADLSQCLKTGIFQEPWENSVTELNLRQSCYA